MSKKGSKLTLDDYKAILKEEVRPTITLSITEYEQLVKRVERLEQRLQKIQPIIDMNTPFGPKMPMAVLSPEQQKAISELGKMVSQAIAKDKP